MGKAITSDQKDSLGPGFNQGMHGLSMSRKFMSLDVIYCFGTRYDDYVIHQIFPFVYLL